MHHLKIARAQNVVLLRECYFLDPSSYLERREFYEYIFMAVYNVQGLMRR